MVKSLRLKQMEEYILEQGVASMDELCAKYDISMNTLRNDISELSERGTIKKVYGGVCSNLGSSNGVISFEERKMHNVQSKREIARAASEFVESGDIIYVDSGTTAVNMIDFLENKHRITIITHSLDVINRAYANAEIDVFCLGGRLLTSTNCFIGATASGMMEHYNIGKAFMGTKGITPDGHITDSSMDEYEIKKWAMSKSGRVFLLADGKKYGRTGLMSYATLSDIDLVITDRSIPDEFIKLCGEMETAVRIV